MALAEVTVSGGTDGAGNLRSLSRVGREEAGRGNAQAAQDRLNRLTGIPLLATTDAVVVLARALIAGGLCRQRWNALHISLCAVHRIDYLLTWNFRHLDNAELKPLVRAICLNNSYACPEIYAPQELMGEIFDEDEIIAAVWQAKDELAEVFSYDLDQAKELCRRADTLTKWWISSQVSATETR